jgi:alpha-mannosidase
VIVLNFKEKLQELGEQVYTKIDDLTIGYVKDSNPIKFDKNLPFKKVRIGEQWGQLFDCAWFKFEGVVSQDTEKLVLMIDVGGEGLVYDSEMNSLTGLTNKNSSYGIPPEKPGKYIVELSNVNNGDPIIVYVDASCNDLMGYVQDGGRITDAYIAIEDDRIKKVFYDLETLIEYSKINDTVNEQIHNAFRLLNEDMRNITTVSLLLDQYYEKRINTSGLDVYATGHAHLDIAWLWPLREGRRKALRTFATALNNMDKYEHYIFGASQYQLFEWVKKDDPKLFDRIKQKVKDGRFELQGVFWVESDLNIPSGESLIRQIYYGKKFIKDEFDMEINYLWEPDVFGFTGALPQLLKKSGVEMMFSQKLSQNQMNKFPHHSYNWEGIDDSIITCHHFPEDTYDSKVRPQSLLKIQDNYIEKDIFPKAMMVYGVGDGGGGPGEEHIERLNRLSKLDGLPKVVSSRVDTYAKELSKAKKLLPTVKGELYFERHRGCYTTEVLNKQDNRNLEYLIHNYLFLTSLRYLLLHDEVSTDDIEHIWKEMLTYQFHDILPGTSIMSVYHLTRKRYPILINEMNDLVNSELEKISSTLAYDSDVMFINPSPFQRTSWSKYDQVWYKVSANPYALGKVITPTVKAYLHQELCLENDHIIAKFSANGSLYSLFNKHMNQEFIDSKMVKDDITIYIEKSDMYPAWDFEEGYREKNHHHPTLTDVKYITDGPQRSIVFEYVYNTSTIRKQVFIYDDDLLRYEITTDWKDINTTVKIHHPITIKNSDVLCNIQFGNITRPTHSNDSIAKAKSEISAHKFIDISDEQYGISMLSKNKYGFYVKENRLELTVLRSQQKNGSEIGIQEDSRYYDNNYGDLVRHTFQYALYPHNKLNYPISVTKKAYNYNHDIISYKGYKKGTISMDETFFVSKKNIIIETIKPSDSGDGVIIRLYETEGKPTNFRLRTSLPYSKAYHTNLMEIEIGSAKLSSLTLKPYEICTLKLI